MINIFKKLLLNKRNDKIENKIVQTLAQNNIAGTYSCFFANEVQKKHEEAFTKYKNINLGKDVIILATGPTLAKFKPIENGIYIGVNRAYQYNKAKLDYIFMQSYHAIKDYIKDVYNLNIPKFFGELIHNNRTFEDLRIPEFEFINSGAKKYYHSHYNCLADISTNIDTFPLFSGATVAHSALHFALYTHPKKIYLVGCDTTSAPYWDGVQREEQYLNVADKVNNICVKGYSRLKQFANIYYPDVEIISINPVGLKGIFKDIYIEES